MVDGLRDQQQALRWLQQNIEAFGGDPARVMIYGQSAGGASVGVQLVAENGTGLFARAVIQSGTCAPRTPTPAPHSSLAAAVAVATGGRAGSCFCWWPAHIAWFVLMAFIDVFSSDAPSLETYGGKFEALAQQLNCSVPTLAHDSPAPAPSNMVVDVACLRSKPWRQLATVYHDSGW